MIPSLCIAMDGVQHETLHGNALFAYYRDTSHCERERQYTNERQLL